MGAAGTLQYQDWCIIRAGGARKFSIFQCQIAVQRHYFMVSKILIFFAGSKGGGARPPHLQRWGGQCPPGPPGATPMNDITRYRAVDDIITLNICEIGWC